MSCNVVNTINVLGAEYKIITEPFGENKTCDAWCDYTGREIHIASDNTENMLDFERSQRKNLRHEIIHAFLAESGLQENFEHREIGHEETMVDWFAIQFPKIFKVYRELDIVDD